MNYKQSKQILEKISKSKGGAEHIAKAAQTYSVDAMRLYYAHVGSPFVDIEWDRETVNKYKNRLANIYKQIKDLMKKSGKEDQFFYLVQEFIDGQDLEEELQTKGTFSESEVLEVLREMLKVLPDQKRTELIWAVENNLRSKYLPRSRR